MIIAEFDWGTDMDIAMLEMRERIGRITIIKTPLGSQGCLTECQYRVCNYWEYGIR